MGHTATEREVQAFLSISVMSKTLHVFWVAEFGLPNSMTVVRQFKILCEDLKRNGENTYSLLLQVTYCHFRWSQTNKPA